ncbi:MAG TPA: thioredoxin domain-containing protein [Vicinamibacterales bacterium]|nr:thioredoxin domain-containing protein [Vicinamibacterales bacterium]
MPNLLARERSPYLLQHADNPVNWFPWGDDAFAAAAREDKPIFLSIGYSTCHWCHVMAHESFEDAGVAAVLNRDFISVKVDREERPDIDRVYMTFVQATTGAGGWPMSVWLTPDRRPFFGGTYFPPSSRWGRPGFVEVLTELSRAWRNERPRLLQSADDIVGRLREMTGADEAAPDRGSVAGREAIDAGIATFTHAFDRRHGGFGGAPKFPRPSELRFLSDAYALTGRDEAKHMAIETLHAMALGGLHDHVGGGFHRYSVDAEWRVPHFEKMLYDQAQLAIAYLDGFQMSGEAFYAAVAENTLAYVVRDLSAPDGAFYSAEDADSEVPGGHDGHEKKEGAFYVWTAAEIDRVFDAAAPIVRRHFGVEDAGNALADPQGEFISQNILYVAQPVEDVAARSGRPVDEVIGVLAQARGTLFAIREDRPRPHRDEKVITAWNGLMIAAFARATRVLVSSPHRDEWRKAATRAAEAAYATLWRPDARRLFRRSRDGDAAIDAFCEDYACLVYGLTELFQATGDARWLTWAVELTQLQIEQFFDDRDGGWFATTGDDPTVLLRLKEDYDGAEPAAASVTVRNLITLGHLTGDATLLSRAERTLQRYGMEIGRAVRVMPFMVANVALWRLAASQVVLVGPPGRADFRALESAVASRLLPAAVVVPVEPQARVGAALPWLAAMAMRDGKATAYVCRDFVCREPVTDAVALGQALELDVTPRIIL